MKTVAKRKRRTPRSFLHRAAYSFFLIASVVVVGTVGMHLIEGMPYLDAFYFTSMIATGQGPSYTPVTAGGKVFVSLLAFLSVGTVITALVFLFGPFFGAVLRSGVEKIEEEAEKEFGRVKEGVQEDHVAEPLRGESSRTNDKMSQS